MQMLYSSEQGSVPLTQEPPFPARLLEAGLSSLQQERYVEGLVIVDRIREELPPHQSHVISLLNALAQSYTTYLRTREELLEAVKRFARADSERQAQLLAVESLLSALQDPTGHTAEMRSSSSITHSPEVPLCDPGLYITCFGSFAVWQASKPMALCSSRNGQGILRYLVAQPRHSASIDSLMALFWPEDEAEVAQRKLHIAMSALRRSLNQGNPPEGGTASILCKDRTYSLNPEMNIHTDVEEFLHFYQTGRRSSEERIASFERACHLYTGPFLSEDRYADWSFPQRERLAHTYITMCRMLADHFLHIKHYEHAMKWSQVVLKENRCDETAHRLLMQIYAAQGYRFEVLRQYQSCERTLHEELGVSPLPETTHLLQTLLSKESPTSPIDKIE